MIDLKTILEEHAKFLIDPTTGKRANLSGSDLRGANLSGANLRDANLIFAHLNSANLSGANLSGSDLRNAYLRDADLVGAHLIGANLSGANLSCANLSGANLNCANLSGANLSGAHLIGANLTSANLSCANLSGANLSCANLNSASLSGANLSGALGINKFSIVPEEGQFTVYKKANKLILTLIVSKYAKRVGGLLGRKCRVSKVKLVKIETLEGHDITSRVTSVTSDYTADFKYKVGKWVTEPEFNDDVRLECAAGIHCFITKQEAKDY